MYHDVDIIDGSKPVKQHPYSMNPVKQQILREEVQYLLDNVSIVKANGVFTVFLYQNLMTFPMCMDYLNVNSITKMGTFHILQIYYCIHNIGLAKYATKFD